MGKFDTFGQVSPYSVVQDYDNREQAGLDSAYMGMMFNYNDQRRQILNKKQEQINELGASIASEYQKISNTTFIDMDKHRGDLEKSFNDNVTSLKNQYAIPNEQRGVEWSRETERLRSNINSPMINNDIRNKEKYDKVYQQFMAGNVSTEKFHEWNEKFMMDAKEGNLYSGPDPTSARENMLTTGWELIKNHNWTANDLDASGAIREDVWDRFMDEVLIEGVYTDGEAKWRNLSEKDRETYYNERDRKASDTELDKQVKATKNYIRKMFADGQNFIKTQREDEYRRYAMARSGDAPQDHWVNCGADEAFSNVRKETHNPDGSVKDKAVPQYVRMPGTTLWQGLSVQNHYVDDEEVQITLPGGGKQTVYVSYKIPNSSAAKFVGNYEDRAKAKNNVKFYWDGEEIKSDVYDIPIELNSDAMENIANNINDVYVYDAEGNKQNFILGKSGEKIPLRLSAEDKANFLKMHSYTNGYETMMVYGKEVPNLQAPKKPSYRINNSIKRGNIVNDFTINSFNSEVASIFKEAVPQYSPIKGAFRTRRDYSR